MGFPDSVKNIISLILLTRISKMILFSFYYKNAYKHEQSFDLSKMWTFRKTGTAIGGIVYYALLTIERIREVYDIPNALSTNVNVV